MDIFQPNMGIVRPSYKLLRQNVWPFFKNPEQFYHYSFQDKMYKCLTKIKFGLTLCLSIYFLFQALLNRSLWMLTKMMACSAVYVQYNDVMSKLLAICTQSISVFPSNILWSITILWCWSVLYMLFSCLILYDIAITV